MALPLGLGDLLGLDSLADSPLGAILGLLGGESGTGWLGGSSSNPSQPS